MATAILVFRRDGEWSRQVPAGPFRKVRSQNDQGWGSKVIDRLAQDLRATFPDIKGFSPRNLKSVRAVAEAQERDIENALIKHVTDFLLVLGAGFAFVGRQVLLNVGGDEFFIDLLFYHLKLRCYVVIELKAGKFKPEHLGKLSFYLAAVDAELKHPQDGSWRGRTAQAPQACFSGQAYCHIRLTYFWCAVSAA